MAHKVILPPKKNYIPQFLKQRDINSYILPIGYFLHERGTGVWAEVLLHNLCPVALHTALNRFMPIFQRALICGRFNLAGYYFT